MLKTRFFLLALVGVAFAAASSAQWLWLDANGRKVFSDQPPPISVSEKDILKQPGAAASESPAPSAAASAPTAAASRPVKITDKEPALEAKKKQAEKEDAAKRKAESDKNAAAKADNCTRAKNNLATLQSGIRIATAGASGERIVMDEPAKTAETKRLQEIVTSDCN